MNSPLLPDLPCFDAAHGHPDGRHTGGRAPADRRERGDGGGADVLHLSTKGTMSGQLAIGEPNNGPCARQARHRGWGRPAAAYASGVHRRRAQCGAHTTWSGHGFHWRPATQVVQRDAAQRTHTVWERFVVGLKEW